MNSGTSVRDLWGQLGERLAADYLKDEGYEIVETNYRCSLGEVDIIAREGPYLVFVEVRLKRSDIFGSPLESVGRTKQMRLRKVSAHYLANICKRGELTRFDVIGITCLEGREPEITLVKDAFYWGQST